MSTGPARIEYPDAWRMSDLMQYHRLKRTDPAGAKALWDANDANNRALGLKAAEASNGDTNGGN